MTYDTAITIRNMNDMRVFASTIVALKGVEPLQYLENGWGYGYAGNFNSFDSGSRQSSTK
jgi:hypothetical protein